MNFWNPLFVHNNFPGNAKQDINSKNKQTAPNRVDIISRSWHKTVYKKIQEKESIGIIVFFIKLTFFVFKILERMIDNLPFFLSCHFNGLMDPNNYHKQKNK